MKNHSGRRSFLRFATSKRNRIISLCILPLVLLLSFLGSSRAVFASSYNTDYTYFSGTYDTDWTISTAYQISNPHIIEGSTDDKIYRWGYDIDYIFTINTNIPTSTFSGSYEYVTEHFFSSNVTITIPLANNILLSRLEYTGNQIDASFDGNGYVTLRNNFGPLNPTAVFFVDFGGYFGNRSYRDNRITFKISFRAEFFAASGLTLSYSLPGVICSSTHSNESYTGYKFPSDSMVLQDIENALDNLQSNNYAIISAIQHAESQAAADADIAQSQAADIIYDINYDDSGTSQSMSATQSAYDAAQGVADAAVDAAVHSYSSDLSTVEAYDYSSFFTSQRNSAVFWRDVGEYILDSSNLGFVSGSIIIVTLIGLVIFMLRL